MRKVIVAICGFFLVCGAYATVDEVDTEIQSAWSFSGYNPKTFITDKYSVKRNDEYGFEYVDIVAAANIYKHGAEFCRMQLQHVYGSWQVYVAPESCQIICKEGYYGTRCNSTTVGNCESSNLTDFFDLNALPIPYKWEAIDVFYSESSVILLAVISSTAHSIKVAPIEFYGENAKGTNIASVNTRGQSYTLCAQGYVLQNNQCVLMSQCNRCSNI